MKTVLGTVIYQESYQFYRDFIDAVNCQTDQDFDIILINDNCSEEEAGQIVQGIPNKTILINKNEQKEPYKLRIQLLKEAKEYGYELLVLADFDDTFHKDRMKLIKNQYDERLTFFYHDLYDFDGMEYMKIQEEQTQSIASILEANYLGLSNTAIVIKNLSRNFIESLEEGKTKIFDWYLFTRILGQGGCGKKVKDAKTFYRIYDNNLAGKWKDIRQQLRKEIEIKKEHYRLVRYLEPKLEELYWSYRELDKKLTSEKIQQIKEEDLINPVYWWGFISIKKGIWKRMLEN